MRCTSATTASSTRGCASSRSSRSAISPKSPYEYSHHVKLGREAGVTDDDIRAINEETAGRPTKLDALSKNVLRAAREMTSDLAMSDATFATLEKALGREQVIDLTLAIAFYNAVVRLLGTLQIDVEPEYQRYLEEHPLPGCGDQRKNISTSFQGAPQRDPREAQPMTEASARTRI